MQNAKKSPRIPEALLVWGPVVLLTVLGAAVAWQFVEPAPPSVVRIASGPEGGSYQATVSQIADSFARRGVSVEARATSGSEENAALLRSGEVDVALLQGGGFEPHDDNARLQGVVSVGFEPVLLAVSLPGGGSAKLDPNARFSRARVAPMDLDELAFGLGRGRVAVGEVGSGTAPLARALLATLVPDLAEDAALPLGGDAAVEGLESGAVEAAFFVASPRAPRVAELLAQPHLAMVSLSQAQSLARRDGLLTPVTLLRGVVDPARDLPAADLETVAATTVLAVRDDTHRGIVQLLVQAARENTAPDLLADEGVFPTLLHSPLPIATEARWFFERGPSVLYRHLPFGLASAADRLTILLLPLVTLLIPLVRVAPPVLRWRLRRRIYRWYRRLQAIEADAAAGQPEQSLIERLETLDSEAAETEVPLSYMEEFYNLRMHIDLLRRRLPSPSAQASSPEAPRDGMAAGG